METQRILVTGGSGFIGTNLCNELRSRGHEVLAVDLLHQRTSEYNHITPQMRVFNRQKAFFSYVMLHAIYRFNIGGK